MTKGNLPLELLNKHRMALGLADSFVFENENDLFVEHPAPIKNAIVFLPKSRALIDMTLALISGMVASDGMIALVGANNAGIGSAKKLYEANIGSVDQKIVGNHSALYVGRNKRLGAEKKPQDFISYFSLIYKDTSIDVANMPGVFSAGELDEGTKLLLDTIPYDRTKVLDVGCGSGVIGAVYKKISPESDVTLCDKSLLAVMATQKTLEKNKVDAKVFASDVLSDIAGTFDLIVTNPPFHKGVATDYTFIEKFSRDAKKYLAPGGVVYVVANSFLSYAETLEKYIGPTETVVDNGKFKIFRSKAR
jgi:16S rRNA (guanine1207-N2)-methyltransferase